MKLGGAYVTFVVTVYGEFFDEPSSSPQELSWGFINPHAKPFEAHVLCTLVL